MGHARAVAIISARHLAASVRKIHVAFARQGLAVRSESGGQGYGSFVKSVLEAVDKFYADVVQRIKP